MKFTCKKELLIKEIQAAQKIIAQKNQITIISNVLLECYNDTLTIKATDTKLRFETKIPIICNKEGKIAIFCDIFLKMLKALPNGEFNLEIIDNKVDISITENNNIKYKLHYQNSDNFPWAADPKKNEFFSISKKTFIHMINTTIFSVSNDEMRLFLNGVFIEKVDTKLIMVATDGKRLSYIEEIIDINIEDFTNIIIPPKFLHLIKELSLNQEGEIALSIKDHHIYTYFDGIKIASSLIDGQFPAYRKAIPEKQEYTALINKNEFIEALKRVTIMADSKSKRFYLDFTLGTLKLHIEDSKIGTARNHVPCEYDGPDMLFAFNYEHFLEPLRVIEGENIIIEFTNSEKAITLRSNLKNSYFHIIMSMNLDNN